MHALREQAGPWGDKVAVFFAGGAVSPMMCAADGQQKDDKERQDERKTNQEEGRDREPKQRADRNEIADLFACCFGVIRCDVEWYIMIHRDIISHIMRYREIRYIEILYPYLAVENRYRDIVSHQIIYRYRTLVSTKAGKRIMRTDEGIHKKWKPNTDHRQTAMTSNTTVVLRCLTLEKMSARGSTWIEYR